MKRLICLVAALLMLAGTALGEAVQLDFSLTADEAAWATLLSNIAFNGASMKDHAGAVAELIASISGKMILQESDSRISISMKDQVLYDQSTRQVEGVSETISTLWPGLLVKTPQEDGLQLASWLEKADLSAIGSELESAFEGWRILLPMTTAEEKLETEMATGMVRQETYTLDDQKVAELMEMLMEVLAKHGLSLSQLQGNLLGNFAALNQQVADENRFSYLWNRVYFEEQWLGDDVTVLENGEQVMTLSAGFSNGLSVVWGYGLNGTNIYMRLEAYAASENSLEVGLIVYADPEHLSYEDVESNAENIVLLIPGTITWTADGDDASNHVDLVCYSTESVISVLYIAADVQRTGNQSMTEVGFYLHDGEGRAEKPLVQFQMKESPAEPVTFDTQGLIPIDANGTLTSEEQNLLTEKIEQAQQEMLVNIFKLIPARLITLLMQ